jgi:hypothetical protein
MKEKERENKEVTDRGRLKEKKKKGRAKKK